MHRTSALQPDHLGTANLTLRRPQSLDGAAVHALIERCPPLDPNSLYCNLLQCSLLASTCVAAENTSTGALVGFVSGFLLPEAQHTLFVWQVAVAPEARGSGLGARMILELLTRPNCHQVTEIQTSITPGNRASWSLFESLSKKLNATLTTQAFFDRRIHFHNLHDSETLVSIRNFSASPAAIASPHADLTTHA